MKHTYIKNILTNELYPTTDFHFGGGVLTYINTSVPPFTLTEGEWEYIEKNIEFSELTYIETQLRIKTLFHLVSKKEGSFMFVFSDSKSRDLFNIFDIRSKIGNYITTDILSEKIQEIQDRLQNDSDIFQETSKLDQQLYILTNLTDQEKRNFQSLISQANSHTTELLDFKKNLGL